MNNKLLMAGVVLAIVLSGAAFIRPAQVETIIRELGALSGPNIYDALFLYGGKTYAKVNATSSSVATYTLIEDDLASGGAFYDTILFTKTGALATTTWTLPATSTMTHVLPQAGMRARQCIRVATTTKTVGLTLAAGTGWDLENATTSLTGGGAINYLTILPGDVGCMEYMRQEVTATSFDITGSLQIFRDAD